MERSRRLVMGALHVAMDPALLAALVGIVLTVDAFARGGGGGRRDVHPDRQLPHRLDHLT